MEETNQTLDQIVRSFAYDYSDSPMSEDELEKMLWNFWQTQEPISKKAYLSQFKSRIDSKGFSDWYLANQ